VKTLASGAIFVTALAFIGPTACSSPQRPNTSTKERRETPPASSPAPQNQADTRPTIATFGDSLTAGVVEKTYPQILQHLLDDYGYQFRVDNQGVAGDTTSDGLARIDNVIAEHPVMVLLEFGGNDGLRGLPVESTRQNLETMIQRLQASGTNVLLLGITLPPNYGPEYIKPFTAMYTDLARQYHLPVMPFLLAHVYQDKSLMQPDGIHPSNAGNEVVARDVFKFIEPELKHLKAK
jgi:acyl-CoA thioesterase-1